MNILVVVSIIRLERNKRENLTIEQSVRPRLMYNPVSISGMYNEKPVVVERKTTFMKTKFGDKSDIR